MAVYRRRKLIRNLLLVSLLSVAVCMVFLSFLQSDLEVGKAVLSLSPSKTLSLTERDTGQRAVVLNGQREILHFEQAHNHSEGGGERKQNPCQLEVYV